MRNENSARRGTTECFSSAGLGIGSTPDELSIAAPNGAGVDFSVNGLMYHYADDASTSGVPAVLAVQAADTTCLYLVCASAAASPVLTVVKGTEELNTDLSAGSRVLHWPTPTVDTCPIGAFKVKTVAVTYTAGTTNLDAAGVTDTYYNFAGGMPVAPLAS